MMIIFHIVFKNLKECCYNTTQTRSSLRNVHQEGSLKNMKFFKSLYILFLTALCPYVSAHDTSKNGTENKTPIYVGIAFNNYSSDMTTREANVSSYGTESLSEDLDGYSYWVGVEILPFLDITLSYTDFGEIKYNGTDRFSFASSLPENTMREKSIDSMELSLIFKYQIRHRLSLIGLIGVYDADTPLVIDGVTDSLSNTGTILGFGADINTHEMVNLRIKYMTYRDIVSDFSSNPFLREFNTEINGISLGASFIF